MAEALLLVVVGSLVPVSVATLVVGLLALRKAQSYVDLVEQRLERLHEGQVLLLALLREQGRGSEEPEQHPETKERVQNERLALAVSERRSAGRETAESKPALRDAPGTRGPSEEEPPKGEARPRLTSLPDTTSSEPAKAQPEDERARHAVWHPHPDDDVSPARAGGPGEAAVEMFRMHYDKYLDNYEGYVKLATRLYRMRDAAEVPPGSGEEREWEGRLRRVTDGIQRTTSRLDILEEYNPELATDDRISRRAAIARSQRELEIKRQQS
jgi:hypothetical protein